VKFAFVRDHCEEFSVDLMCRVLSVSRSGYYAWSRRAPSSAARRRQELTERIRQVHRESREVYGAPRVHQELLATGVRCGKNTVAKLMREGAIRSKTRGRFIVRTTDSRHGHPIAPNRLNRRFHRSRPNEAWVADITYVPTGEGWLYLAAVLDVYSRKVVGWATSDSLAADLSCQALRMAVQHRSPTGAVLHHSDRGVQYACEAFQELLFRHGMKPSMSRTGNCYDNAVMESFFSTLKRELTHHHSYPTREAARQSLFEYIEVFYNRRRRHSAVGYLSPADYERRTARRETLRSVGKSTPRASRQQLQRPRETVGRGLTGRWTRNSNRYESSKPTFIYPH
jgi:transposase InsO family protein